MADKRAAVGQPERRVVNATIAEFVLRGPADSAELARRARMLAALVELPVRRRKELEEAVDRVCQVLGRRGSQATVRFALTMRDGQRYVEVSVRDEQGAPIELSAAPPSPDADDGPSPSTSAAGDGQVEWSRLGEMLDLFDMSNWAQGGVVIRMAQALSPAFAAPTEAEAQRWAQMLHSRSLEEALVQALRFCRTISLELSQIRSRIALQEQFGDTTAIENLAMLSLVASKSSNLVTFMDAQGRITWVNEAFVEATGYLPLEAIGKRPDELLFGPSTDEAAVRAFQQALHNGHDLKTDIMLYRRDGRTFWVEYNLIPIRDDSGQITRWLSVDVDITQRRQTEEALRAAKERAEASARLKSEFLANMSHEIRTPLNAIIGMTELALATDLTPEQRDYLRTVQTSAESLLQLLNDILDLSKIEAGKLQIDEVDFNLAEAIRDTLKALAVKAHEKGLELAAHVPMDMPQYVRGDPTRLKQILFNLLGNAIKFTHQGEVVLEVESQWQTEDEIGLHFAVRDTGVGIPKEKLQQIFEAFTQADSATTRQFGGTGLGLTITAELVRLMGGKIWVESTVGRGSTFHFTLQLKLAKSQPPRIEREKAPQLAGKRVLIVDDNRTNRRILAEMLSHWDMKPDQEDSAAEALKAIEDSTRRGAPYDLVLLDAMMPGTDGFQLLRTLRERTDLRYGPVVMLSSIDRPYTMAECRKLGVAHYLTKPISVSSLLDAVLSAVVPPREGESAGGPGGSGGAAEREQKAGTEEPPPAQRLKILVADDHEANRRLATKVLSKRGHHCVEAADGAEAVAALENEAFDIALLDVQMPKMDGLSVTRAIREKEKATGGHLPIIALTAHAMKGDREKCLAAGMDAYLAKPLRPRELVALVESIVGATTHAEVEAVTSSSASQQPTAAVQDEICDFDTALESMDGDQELLIEQMRYFVHDAPELLDQIRQAIETGDPATLERSAHRLKGLVARYSTGRPQQLAYELEQAGRSGQLEDVRELYDQLAPLVEQMVREVEDYVAQRAAES